MGSRTRRFRHRAHKAFDRLWQSGTMSRGNAYAWMAKYLRVKTANISSLDEEECEQVIIAMEKQWPELFPGAAAIRSRSRAGGGGEA